MNKENRVMRFDYIDFEKVVFGWQHIIRYFKLGEHKQVVIDYDPGNPKIQIFFFAPDKNGVMRREAIGSITRFDGERFALSLGRGFMGDLVGKKQRIIVDYDPQNEKAFVEFQNGPVMRSIGSSGINVDMDS